MRPHYETIPMNRRAKPPTKSVEFHTDRKLVQRFIIKTWDGNECAIDLNDSVLVAVFVLVIEDPKYPEPGTPISMIELQQCAQGALEALNDLFCVHKDIGYLQSLSDSVDKMLGDAVTRLMLQIGLTFKVAQAINTRDEWEFTMARQWFFKMFTQPLDFPSMVYDPIKYKDWKPIPFDAYIRYNHPAMQCTGEYIRYKYGMSIEQPDSQAQLTPKFEKILDQDTRFRALMLNQWKVGLIEWQTDGSGVTYLRQIPPKTQSEANIKRITRHGFECKIVWHLWTVGIIYFACFGGVIFINTWRRDLLENVGVDPSSLLSLLVVLIGIFTTALKATLMQEWSWYDFIRGRYYLTRIDETQINEIAACGINANKSQQAPFNKVGFSYLIGATATGPITADVPVSSAELIKHGVIVARTAPFGQNHVIILPRNDGIWHLELIDVNEQIFVVTHNTPTDWDIVVLTSSNAIFLR
ncbi:hypothetical protein BC940DRAFT_347694 [Gongronella butleri]|nr:hypothetical protein BC940DRAFT_347694 [Gongronella butleri]